TAAERQQLLVEWNATDQRREDGGGRIATGRSRESYPRSPILHPQVKPGIHALFEVQVERTPNIVAVVFDRPPTTDHRPPTTDEGDKETSRQGDKETANPKLNTQHSTLKTSPPSSILYPQCLTYCGLNTRANQLAHYLRRLGVGPDALVGICVE